MVGSRRKTSRNCSRNGSCSKSATGRTGTPSGSGCRKKARQGRTGTRQRLQKKPDKDEQARQAAAAAEKARQDEQAGQAAAAAATEQAFWQRIESSGNPDDFDHYLEQFPKGRFVDEARYQIFVLRALKCGHVGKGGWIGVGFKAMTGEIAQRLGLDGARGALIGTVSEGGPAEHAGIRPGDVILGFDGSAVTDMHKLPCLVADKSPGESVYVTFWRQRSGSGTQLKVGRMVLPDPTSAPVSVPAPPSIANLPVERRVVFPRLGVTLSELTPDARRKIAIPSATSGVLVVAVSEGGPAGAKGLKPGDLILTADGQSVSNPAQFREIVGADWYASRKPILLLVERQGDRRFVALSFRDR